MLPILRDAAPEGIRGARLLGMRLSVTQHSMKASTASARADTSTRLSDSILLASPGELSPSVVSQRRSLALHTVRKYYPVQRDEVSPLTALRNVVAYPGRHSLLRIGNMGAHEPPTGSHMGEQ